MAVEKLDTLEERIQKPGYLLLLVVVLLFLIIGLVDLVDNISKEPVLFGRYSISYFIMLIFYSVLVLGWASLLLRPNDDRWLTRSLDTIQQRPILALLILASIGILLVSMIVTSSPVYARALSWPALQVTAMVILLLAAGLILFYRWGDDARPQRWRKVVLILLGILLLVELLVQGLAYFGLLPSVTTTNEGFTPYARIYHTEEGFGNGVANSFGRYTPEFELLPDSQRTAIVGGSLVQGLQVEAGQNLGVMLQEQVTNNGQEGNSEILNLGYPNYGPGVYLSSWMNRTAMEAFELDEAIAFFDLGKDFQTVSGPGRSLPYFYFDAEGEIEVADVGDSGFWLDFHIHEHDVFFGYEGFQLVRLLGSHYLTPRVLADLMGEEEIAAGAFLTNENDDIDLANGFVFDEESNDEAMAVATALISKGREQFEGEGVAFKLVTVPVFSEAFYEQASWNTQFGASDLLLPEVELRAFAAENGIPFLGLGAHMKAAGLTPAEVQALYLADGRGHFTPAGHAFAAQAAFDCFFAQTASPEAGCDRR